MAHVVTKQSASGEPLRRRWRRLGFAQRLLILVLVAILPLLILAIFLLAWGVREYRLAVDRGLSDTALALGIAVDEQIVTWRSALEALSTSPSFDSKDFSSDFYDQLVAVAKQHNGDIVIFDETLAQRLNTRRPYGALLPKAGYPEPKRRTFATGLPQVSGPFIGTVAKRWLVALDVPVKRGGRTIYSLNISFPPDHVSDLLSQKPLSRGRIVHVINEDGLFVARSEGAVDVIGRSIPAWYAEWIASGESGIVEGPSPVGGPEQILAFQRLHEAPWTLAVAAPKDALAATWRQPMWLFGGLSLLIVLGTAGLTWLFSRRVTGPMEALAASASDVLQGRRAKMTPLKIPEFETLRQALEQAAAVARDRLAVEARAAVAEDTAEEMRQSEERQRLLAEEVDHRAKNLLTVVQSILQLTQADDIESYQKAVSGRIMALARSHSLIAASRWRGADLAQIVDDELAPYRAYEGATTRAHVEVTGPSVILRPAAAQSLAIVVHELTTNAVKYGALSSSEGRLSVDWRVTEDGLSLTWDEAGGAPLAGPPQRHSFGTRIVAASIERELDGRITFDWRREGLVVSILVPPGQISGESMDWHRENQGASAATNIDSREASLAGRRILIVEDEALIAGQIKSLLLIRGCSVVGPAPRLDKALALARSESFDAAILDVNLSGSRSDPVANTLRERGIPFIVLTGYADSGLSSAFHRAPVVAKPFEAAALMNLVALEISNSPPPLHAGPHTRSP